MIEENLLNQEQFRKVFNYLKEMANHLTIADITQINEKVNKYFLKLTKVEKNIYCTKKNKEKIKKSKEKFSKNKEIFF